MRNPRSTADMVGTYGPTWRHGVLAEHAELFAAQGGRLLTLASGSRQVAVTPEGDAYPVVCGDLVEVPTEDGPISGRCGADAVPGRFACEGHADERDGWLAMPEYERAAWERRQDGVPA